MIGRLVTILALLALPAATPAAETVVAGLSQDRIEITANYDGSNILIYGAVKREEPIPTASRLDVVVTVEGPSASLKVLRKARRFGLWINTDAVVVDSAPSFYAVATTAPFANIISDTEDLRHSVSIPRAIRSVGAPQNVLDAQDFTAALIHLRESEGLYSMNEGGVNLFDQTLFRTNVQLPANLVEGIYKIRIFLLRDRQVVDLYEKTLYVRKVGMERWLFRLSRNQPALYGVLALTIAAAAGWAASAAFRMMRA